MTQMLLPKIGSKTKVKRTIRRKTFENKQKSEAKQWIIRTRWAHNTHINRECSLSLDSENRISVKYFCGFCWIISRRAKMEMFYYLVFGALGALVAALELTKTNKDRINTSSAFNSFKNNYLLVYSLMMGTSFFLDLNHFLVLIGVDLTHPLNFGGSDLTF